MKISRNEKCPCGSGKKYKNCCLNKKTVVSYKINDVLKIIKDGLENYDKLSQTNHKYVVKDVKYLNGETVVVSYITDKKNSMDIKIEMGEIVAFIGSFFLTETEGLLVDIPKFIGVKAYNLDNIQILYVVSSISSAKDISEGKSIEWLKNSHFEDTTQDFILKLVKGQISTIEKSLRKLIYSELYKNHQNDWIQKIVKYTEMVKLYKKNTADIPPNLYSESILDYSFLPDLKIIIENNFSDFSKYFKDKNTFIDNMNRLNKIRRDESHNREISIQQKNELESIYNYLLENISKVDPNIVPQYIIDNWHQQLFRIINIMQKSIPSLQEEDRHNYTKTMLAMKQYWEAVDIAHSDLDNILIPLNKKDIHDRFNKLLNDLKSTLGNMISFGESVKVSDLEKKFVKYQELMQEVKDFEKHYLISEL